MNRIFDRAISIGGLMIDKPRSARDPVCGEAAGSCEARDVIAGEANLTGCVLR
jgi:hypothetical protein